MTRTGQGILLVALALTGAFGDAATPPVVLEPCGPEGAEKELQCGVLTVPEEPGKAGRPHDSAPHRRRARARATRGSSRAFRARGRPRSRPDRRSGAVRRAAQGVPPLPRRRTRRSERNWRVGSTPLPGARSVDASRGNVSDRSGREVPRELEQKADLTQYSTAHSVHDLDALRKALGYEKIDLFGVSYGSELARAYMAAHPAHVRRVLLIGTTETDFRTPLTHAAHAQRVLDLLSHEC